MYDADSNPRPTPTPREEPISSSEDESDNDNDMYGGTEGSDTDYDAIRRRKAQRKQDKLTRRKEARLRRAFEPVQLSENFCTNWDEWNLAERRPRTVFRSIRHYVSEIGWWEGGRSWKRLCGCRDGRAGTTTLSPNSLGITLILIVILEWATPTSRYPHKPRFCESNPGIKPALLQGSIRCETFLRPRTVHTNLLHKRHAWKALPGVISCCTVETSKR